MAEEKIFIAETIAALTSNKEDIVLAKVNELKSKGKAVILPYILALLDSSNSANVKQEVILLISNLKDQNCVPYIIKYIQENPLHPMISQVIATCWQSSLNFSEYLDTFIESFISGDYQAALESFTVIEEMLWQSDRKSILNYKKNLIKESANINSEKKPLYKELIKVLEEGRSISRDEYTDLIQ